MKSVLSEQFRDGRYSTFSAQTGDSRTDSPDRPYAVTREAEKRRLVSLKRCSQALPGLGSGPLLLHKKIAVGLVEGDHYLGFRAVKALSAVSAFVGI